jgi:hypothetical protein
MPYVIQCPSCSTKLKSAQPVPAGKTVTCPQCKNPFTTAEAAQEVNGQPAAPAPATAEAPKPAPVAAQAPARVPPAPPPMPARPAKSVTGALDAFTADKRGRPADGGNIRDAEIVDDDDRDDRPKARRRRDDEDDEDDRPRARRRGRDEDEDDRPRARGRDRDEDDDDRPRARKRREDEEDEEDDRPRGRAGRGPKEDSEDELRPRRRKVEDDEDDDDRPRSKRRKDEDDDDQPRSKRRQDDDEDDRPKSRKARGGEDDEDDEDDRPRGRKAGKKKKKGKKVLLIALLGGAAALLLGAVLVVLLVDPFGLFGGGASSEMLAWAPAETQSITYVDVDGARSVEGFNNGFGGVAGDSTKLGLKADEVSAVLGASKSGGGVFGLLGGDPDVMVIKLKASADRTKIINAAGGKEATANGKKYYKTNGGGGLYFPSDRLIVATKAESTLTGLLQKDDGKVVVSDDLRSAVKRADGIVSMVSSGQAAESGDILGLMAGAANPFAGMGPGGPAAAKTGKVKTTLFTVKASGNRATAKVETTYDSAETATKIAEGLQKMLEQNKGKIEADSHDVSRSGSTVTLTMSGPINKGKNMMGFGFGGK